MAINAMKSVTREQLIKCAIAANYAWCQLEEDGVITEKCPLCGGIIRCVNDEFTCDCGCCKSSFRGI